MGKRIDALKDNIVSSRIFDLVIVGGVIGGMVYYTGYRDGHKQGVIDTGKFLERYVIRR